MYIVDTHSTTIGVDTITAIFQYKTNLQCLGFYRMSTKFCSQFRNLIDRDEQFSTRVPLIQLTWETLVTPMRSLLKTGVVLSWSCALAVPQLKELQPSVILQEGGMSAHCSNSARIPGTWIGPGGPISYALPISNPWIYPCEILWNILFTEYLWMAPKPFLQG